MISVDNLCWTVNPQSESLYESVRHLCCSGIRIWWWNVHWSGFPFLFSATDFTRLCKTIKHFGKSPLFDCIYSVLQEGGISVGDTAYRIWDLGIKWRIELFCGALLTVYMCACYIFLLLHRNRRCFYCEFTTCRVKMLQLHLFINIIIMMQWCRVSTLWTWRVSTGYSLWKSSCEFHY